MHSRNYRALCFSRSTCPALKMYQTVESFTAVTLPQQSPRHCATFDEADLNQCQPQVKSAYCQTEMKITAGDLSRNKTHMPKHPSHCAHSIDIPLRKKQTHEISAQMLKFTKLQTRKFSAHFQSVGESGPASQRILWV